MKHKGFDILPEYHVGSDFTVKNGVVKPRRPTANDVAYWVIHDPLENGDRWIAEDTKEECKRTIDEFLARFGAKTNADLYKEPKA